MIVIQWRLPVPKESLRLWGGGRWRVLDARSVDVGSPYLHRGQCRHVWSQFFQDSARIDS